MAKAKFGLFNSGLEKPGGEFEGDYMLQSGEYVSIWNESVGRKHLDGNEQVAAIRLIAGQFVRKL